MPGFGLLRVRSERRAELFQPPVVGQVGLDRHDRDPSAGQSPFVGVIGDLLARPVGTPLCLNVNVPVGKSDELHGVRLCRQNAGYWREEFFRREDPNGREYFWLTGNFVNTEPDAEDTDE